MSESRGRKYSIAQQALWLGTVVTVVGILAACAKVESAEAVARIVSSFAIVISVSTATFSGANAWITGKVGAPVTESSTITSTKTSPAPVVIAAPTPSETEG